MPAPRTIRVSSDKCDTCDLLLVEAKAHFAQMVGDPRLLAAYRAESDQIADSFGTAAPDW